MTFGQFLILAAVMQFPGEPMTGTSEHREAVGTCLSGRVISPISGASHRMDVLLMLRGENHSDYANVVAGGSFRFCNVPSGDYVLEASAPEHKSWRQSLSTRDSLQESEITIVLEPLPRPEYPAPGSATVDFRALQIPRSARKEHERFLEYAARGDWKKSRSALEKAIAVCPEYFDAWNNLGIVLAKLKEDNSAEAAFLKAIEIDPKAPIPQRNLGYFHLVRGLREDARAHLERAVQLNPQDARTHVYLARLLSETGSPEEAVKHLELALVLEHEMPLALYELGFVQLRLNRTQQALQCFERYLQSRSNDGSSEEVRSIIERLRNTSP